MTYSNSKRFYINTGKYNFGYQIVDKGESGKMPYKVLFHSSNKAETLKIWETIEEKHTDLITPTQDWEPQLLLTGGSYNTTYFLVKSPEHLNQISFDYVKHCYESSRSDFSKWTEDKVNLISKESINSCNVDWIKDNMITHNDRQLKNKKANKEHNDLIDRVIKLLESGSTKRAFTILMELSEGGYESIELNHFDN